jgi:SAM-dependent methyltransferase
MNDQSGREARKRCGVCEEGALDHVFSKDGCDILRCNKCGVGSTIVHDFNPASYYTKDYFEGGHRDGYAEYGRSEEILRQDFARLVSVLRSVAPQGGALLEIGCAYGFFLHSAQDHWHIHGLEISEDAVQRCHADGLSNVRQGMADQAALATLPPLQAIVMLDVIEHLPDPVAVLQACYEKLVPGGVLMLTTGDFGSPVARLFGSRWRLMTPPQHLWFFTAKGFRALAKRQGWNLLRLTHPGKRVPLSLIVYQLLRMIGFRAGRVIGSSRIGVPVNLGDAMLLLLQRPEHVR